MIEPYPPRGGMEDLVLELDSQHVACRRTDVLDGVNHRLAPGERPRLPLVDLRLLAIHGDFGCPIGEVDTQPVRVAMSRLDASRRNVDLEHAHEGILERHLARVRRYPHR